MLDANFIDVYKGTHAVIFVYDVTERRSFDYVEREISKVSYFDWIFILR